MERIKRKLPNDDIRKMALMADVRHWEICKQLGISEPTFTRWLRTELSDEKRERILSAIHQIEAEREAI